MVYDGVIQGRGHPETKCGRAVGSHTTLRAVGQGALGDRVPRKIEMFSDGRVECRLHTLLHLRTSICQDRQKAKDREHLPIFSKRQKARQKARQKKPQNKKKSAKQSVQSKTQNTRHLMRRSWQHTEQHTLCQRLQQDRLTKKRAKLGSMDNPELTASLTTGLPTSKLSHNERNERNERKVRNNSKFNNR